MSGTPPVTSAARTRAATALRDLAHALVGHDADEHRLEELADWADGMAATLRTGTERRRADDALVHEVALAPLPPDGARIEHFADCPVSGADNPFSLPATAFRDGDDVVVRATLGRAHEGAPGRSHGGVVAALFDDGFGFLSSLGNAAVYAGTLQVRYVRPTPLNSPLELRCSFGELIGRKQHASGVLRHGGEVVAEATVVLITVPLDTVGRAGR